MIAAVILAALCAVLGLRLYALEKDIRSCARQLREDEGARVRMAAPNRAAEDLLSAVNRLLELREADEAEHRRQEHAIRQQISNISHDLRTPLTSILGYLQLLEGDSLTVEERREYLGIVRGRAKALQSLITSFYDLSRLESGEYPLRREKVDLYTSLSGLLAAFYNDFTDAGFDVTVDLAQGLPSVTADPSGVLRVFTNLLRNALDHGQGQMEVRLFREGDAVVSLFRNGSGGITQEDIPHVFDRFFTADKMRTGRNTGLGLAIVKALADQMGCGLEAGLDGAFFFVRIRWKL